MVRITLFQIGNLLNKFVTDFVRVLDEHKIEYSIVSGFVALSHGRSRY